MKKIIISGLVVRRDLGNRSRIKERRPLGNAWDDAGDDEVQIGRGLSRNDASYGRNDEDDGSVQRDDEVIARP